MKSKITDEWPSIEFTWESISIGSVYCARGDQFWYLKISANERMTFACRKEPEGLAEVVLTDCLLCREVVTGNPLIKNGAIADIILKVQR